MLGLPTVKISANSVTSIEQRVPYFGRGLRAMTHKYFNSRSQLFVYDDFNTYDNFSEHLINQLYPDNLVRVIRFMLMDQLKKIYVANEVKD
jgi:hypothetical protein